MARKRQISVDRPARGSDRIVPCLVANVVARPSDAVCCSLSSGPLTTPVARATATLVARAPPIHERVSRRRSGGRRCRGAADLLSTSAPSKVAATCSNATRFSSLASRHFTKSGRCRSGSGPLNMTNQCAASSVATALRSLSDPPSPLIAEDSPVHCETFGKVCKRLGHVIFDPRSGEACDQSYLLIGQLINPMHQEYVARPLGECRKCRLVA